MTTTKLTLFVASKDDWDTKEGPGKSMKNVLYESSLYLAIVKLCKSESISQSKILLNNFFLNSVANFWKCIWKLAWE